MNAGRRQGIERQAEGAGEVVGRAQRQDGQRQAALHQGRARRSSWCRRRRRGSPDRPLRPDRGSRRGNRRPAAAPPARCRPPAGSAAPRRGRAPPLRALALQISSARRWAVAHRGPPDCGPDGVSISGRATGSSMHDGAGRGMMEPGNGRGPARAETVPDLVPKRTNATPSSPQSRAGRGRAIRQDDGRARDDPPRAGAFSVTSAPAARKAPMPATRSPPTPRPRARPDPAAGVRRCRLGPAAECGAGGGLGGSAVPRVRAGARRRRRPARIGPARRSGTWPERNRPGSPRRPTSAGRARRRRGAKPPSASPPRRPRRRPPACGCQNPRRAAAAGSPVRPGGAAPPRAPGVPLRGDARRRRSGSGRLGGARRRGPGADGRLPCHRLGSRRRHGRGGQPVLRHARPLLRPPGHDRRPRRREAQLRPALARAALRAAGDARRLRSRDPARSVRWSHSAPRIRGAAPSPAERPN